MLTLQCGVLSFSKSQNRNTGKKVFKMFRGSSFVLLAESCENHKGSFMKITKILNGLVRNLVVPSGWNGWGWLKFAEGIDFALGRRVGPLREKGKQKQLFNFRNRILEYHRSRSFLEPVWSKGRRGINKSQEKHPEDSWKLQDVLSNKSISHSRS